MGTNAGGTGLTRRRVLGAALTTGLAAAGAGAGTYALFSDVESSSGNTVQAGTLDLTVSNAGDFSFQISDGAPGAGTANNQVTALTPTLSNEGTTPADHVEIDVAVTGTTEDADGDPSSGDIGPESDPTNGASNMGQWVEVDQFSYTGIDGGETTFVENGQATTSGADRGFADTNGNGFIDLADLDALSEPDEGALDGFSPPEAVGEDRNGNGTAGEDTDVSLALGLAEGMPNDFQGDILTTTVTVSLLQEDSQDTDIA